MLPLIIKIERADGLKRLLTSGEYEYNSIGEMEKAYDAKKNALTVEYDQLGRRVAVESADMGRYEYTYNGKGQLAEETSSELRRRGGKIRYEYDEFGRNERIRYPETEDTVYEYGGPEGKDENQAGRLVGVTDASGKREYRYGKLGETVEERRKQKQRSGHTAGTAEREAVFEYLGDYLGRMEKIVYPDGEEVGYKYDNGGNVVKVSGTKAGVTFGYVEEIGYDEYGQRVYMRLGNGVETEYRYDEDRRWLESIKTTNKSTITLQKIDYTFDKVGNVQGYRNTSSAYSSQQSYEYDGLYQLTRVEGESKNYKYGLLDFTARYMQEYRYDGEGLGNMTLKTSTTGSSTQIYGDVLDYQMEYTYEAGSVHRASRIGEREYRYDLNGNVTREQEGGNGEEVPRGKGEVKAVAGEAGVYYVEEAWGINEGTVKKPVVYRMEYEWDERNRLKESRDTRYSVIYTYGEDGERTSKYTVSGTGGNDAETQYFGRLWTWKYNGLLSDRRGYYSKHIFLGESRIVTKTMYADGSFVPAAEEQRQYYYHGDHLGSAQLITNYRGEEYERIEYTPHGELWIERGTAVSGNEIPYRFTGKERDAETGLYYYGARYLDSKTCRWISTDPAMYQGDYIPGAPINDEAKKRNGNLPGQGGVFNYVNMHVYHYAGNNPVKYRDPDGRKINGLTDDQWNTVKQDIDSAVNNLNDIIQQLSDFNTGKTDTLSQDMLFAANEYLGVDFSLPLDAKELGSRLTDIRDYLGSLDRSDFRYDDKTKSYAYVFAFGDKMFLGDKYFSSSNTGNDTRQGTLIHEGTHKFQILFTNDRGYGTGAASNLRVDNRVNYKARNADNWEYFYERIKTGGR